MSIFRRSTSLDLKAAPLLRACARTIKILSLLLWRELTKQLVIMATTDFTHRMNISENEKQSRITIFADSWLIQRRLKSARIHENCFGKLVVLDPHEVILENNYIMSTAMLDNFSVGSATMDGYLRDTVLIKIWGENLPNITIIHLGACDLANDAIGRSTTIKKDWSTKLKEFITKLISTAKIDNIDIVKFENKLKNHKFLVIGIPSWGDYGQSLVAGGLNSDAHALARKQANDGIRSNLKTLYEDYNVVVHTPRLNFPHRVKVHLGERSLELYTDQILAVAIRLMCTHCQLSPTYNKVEHVALADGSCLNQQH